MKRNLFVISVVVALFVSLTSASAQSKRYTVLFYNVENLFDTIQDPTIYDTEFIPSGVKQWNSAKYYKKLDNLEKVFYSITEQNRSYPTVIGVSEVENRNVLEDIASLPKLQRANYQICHYDGPDARGVDVAFFYRPDQFKYEGSESIKANIPGARPNFRTRDLLGMWGTIDGEPFYFMVSHWPSRRGGQAQSAFLREGLAAQIKGIADSVMRANPKTKFVVMGDFNDDPGDKSVSECLGAKLKKDKLKKGDLYNPYWQMHRDGYGTLVYNDLWNLYDNIVVSENIANPDRGTLGIWKPKKAEYYGNVFRGEFLFQKEGQYKGYPLRTYVGNNFQGGFSDHLPVYIFLVK
ncbi:MAG: endonuclease/exonuclease/phosphatase family protein [Tidjanibacter sp.]|nr:endonuclease/exonuclease/phosphatase family protein [Tidjanibacter sp.]